MLNNSIRYGILAVRRFYPANKGKEANLVSSRIAQLYTASCGQTTTKKIHHLHRKLSNRNFCTEMEGEIVHDKDNQVFFVQLTNDGGKPLSNILYFRFASIK